MEQWEILGKILDKLEKPKKVTLKNHKDFEDFLQDYFIRNNPHCLDDDIPDAFSEWIADLDSCEWLEFGDKYAKAIKDRYSLD